MLNCHVARIHWQVAAINDLADDVRLNLRHPENITNLKEKHGTNYETYPGCSIDVQINQMSVGLT